MPTPREVLTPDALSLLQAVADTGSFAGAARALGVVPSAVTYRIRQIEDALDVLLFDRSSRQARLTPAGDELLCAGRQLLREIDDVAHRVKRVATGWEAEFTVAVDCVLAPTAVMELAEAFYTLAPTTRLRLRDEALSGLGDLSFVYAMAPHHPLARAREPVRDEVLVRHRGVAVADTTQRGDALTIGLLAGQDVLTVPSMRAKLDALIRGLGSGFLPEPLARPYLETGRLVARRVQRQSTQTVRLLYAWREVGPLGPGRALQWWLAQLESAATRTALLERHRLP